MTENELFQTLETLAAAARPIDDDEWGSERQIAAENAFDSFVEEHMHPMAFAEYSDWALKATSDEKIDEAMRLLREAAVIGGRSSR